MNKLRNIISNLKKKLYNYNETIDIIIFSKKIYNINKKIKLPFYYNYIQIKNKDKIIKTKCGKINMIYIAIKKNIKKIIKYINTNNYIIYIKSTQGKIYNINEY